MYVMLCDKGNEISVLLNYTSPLLMLIIVLRLNHETGGRYSIRK